MSRWRARGRAASVLLCATLALAGCPEWLEVDDPDAEVPGTPATAEPLLPARLPTLPPRFDAPGPVVPGTPGLKVPEGYWTRVRLDVADLLLPHTWLALDKGEGRVFLRMQASGASRAVSSLGVRAALVLTLPSEAAVDDLRGVTLGADSVASGTVGVRTSATDNWLVDVERISFEEMTSAVIKGSIEGTARRGSKGRTERRCEIAFLALRAQ